MSPMREGRLALPEGRELAWCTPSEVCVVMPRGERECDLGGIQTIVRYPRTLVRFGAHGTKFVCGSGGLQIANAYDDGGICYGHNPTPQDPYEAWAFYWNGTLTMDLVAPHPLGRCDRRPCERHPDLEDCEHEHQCTTEGGCICRPACVCRAPAGRHHHGYWADHRRGSRAWGTPRFVRDERCHCCTRTCGHGGAVVCRCRRLNWVCPCSNGECGCLERDVACTPAAAGCGCGAEATWRQKATDGSWADWSGGPSFNAIMIPNEAASIRWPSGAPLDSRGRPIEVAPQQVIDLGTHRFAVGNLVRVLPASPMPTWWQLDGNQIGGYVGHERRIVRLLSRGFYDLGDSAFTDDTQIEDARTGFQFQVGDVVYFIGQPASTATRVMGRCLRITRRSVSFNRARIYQFAETGTAWIAEAGLRAREAGDPEPGLPDPYRFRIGQRVKLQPPTEDRTYPHEEWCHYIGRVFEVDRRSNQYGDVNYFTGTPWGRYITFHEGWLQATDEPITAEPPLGGYQAGRAVRLVVPDVQPEWWSPAWNVLAGRELIVNRTERASDLGMRLVRLTGLPNTVRESALEPVDGVSLNEPRVLQIPSCRDLICVACPKISIVNPNYREATSNVTG